MEQQASETTLADIKNATMFDIKTLVLLHIEHGYIFNVYQCRSHRLPVSFCEWQSSHLVFRNSCRLIGYWWKVIQVRLFKDVLDWLVAWIFSITKKTKKKDDCLTGSFQVSSLSLLFPGEASLLALTLLRFCLFWPSFSSSLLSWNGI